jgi:membrane-bound ClpP family serine protease
VIRVWNRRDGGYQINVDRSPHSYRELAMIVLGLILFLLGLFLHVGIIETIGLVLLIVGAVLWILGAVGRPIAGRRHYW